MICFSLLEGKFSEGWYPVSLSALCITVSPVHTQNSDWHIEGAQKIPLNDQMSELETPTSIIIQIQQPRRCVGGVLRGEEKGE